MKQNLPEPSTRATKCIYLGVQVKDKNNNHKNLHNKPSNHLFMSRKFCCYLVL
jgi:hypothetical protein